MFLNLHLTLNISSKWLALPKHTSRPSHQSISLERPFHLDISTLWSPTSLVNSQLSPWSSLSFPVHLFSLLLREVTLLSHPSPPSPFTFASSSPHASFLPFPLRHLQPSEAVSTSPAADFLLGPYSTTSAVHNFHSLSPIEHVCSVLKDGQLWVQGYLQGNQQAVS